MAAQAPETELTQSPGQTGFHISPPGELDLFALLMLLRRHLWRTVVFACAAFVAMAAYTLWVKPQFTSMATIVIPQKSAGLSSLALQAAGGGGLDLMGGGYEIYIDILRSRTVQDSLIQQYNLRQHYGLSSLEMAEHALALHSVIAVQKEGLLSVTVTDVDPRLAADLANSYLTQLDLLNQHLAITAAGQQRAYYESQMIGEKNALAEAEVSLERYQQKTGAVAPEQQTQAGLTAVEQTRATIRALQVELGAMEQGATAQNPEVVRLRAEIGGLESQLRALQSGGGSEVGSPVTRLPAQNLDYVRALREVKFHEGLFDMLARQYEGAKGQEAKDVSMLEILDRARPAERKSWPPRTVYCLIAFLAGGALGIVFTLLEAFARVVFFNPENRATYRALLSPGRASLRRGEAR